MLCERSEIGLTWKQKEQYSRIQTLNDIRGTAYMVFKIVTQVSLGET